MRVRQSDWLFALVLAVVLVGIAWALAHYCAGGACASWFAHTAHG